MPYHETTPTTGAEAFADPNESAVSPTHEACFRGRKRTIDDHSAKHHRKIREHEVARLDKPKVAPDAGGFSVRNCVGPLCVSQDLVLIIEDLEGVEVLDQGPNIVVSGGGLEPIEIDLLDS